MSGALVEIAGAESEIDASLVAFHTENAEARHGGRQGLGAAHAAETGCQHPSAGGLAAVVLAARLGEGLIGSLHDALAADVDPGSRRHLAVHHEALAVQFVEMVPVRPGGHQVGIGDQHPGRVGVGFKDPHRLAGLHQQGLVILEFPQALQDPVEAFPVPGGAAHAAIDDQFRRILRHLRIEIVLDHAKGRLGEPALALQGGPPGGGDASGVIGAGSFHGSADQRMVNWSVW